MLIKTTTRLIETRGLPGATRFVRDYLNAAPWSPRWAAFIDRYCRDHLGTAAPLDLIHAGFSSRDSAVDSKRLHDLCTHYDLLGAYLSDAALGRLIFGQPLRLAVVPGYAGALYGLELATLPVPHGRGEAAIVLRCERMNRPVAVLPVRLARAGSHGIALRLGQMQLCEGVEAVERDLHGMPVRAVVMDAVYAMVRVLGIIQMTAENAADNAFWLDCGGEYIVGARLRLPLQYGFWRSKAGRKALGDDWVPQQMLRTTIMSDADDAVASWLKYDDSNAARTEPRPVRIIAH